MYIEKEKKKNIQQKKKLYIFPFTNKLDNLINLLGILQRFLVEVQLLHYLKKKKIKIKKKHFFFLFLSHSHLHLMMGPSIIKFSCQHIFKNQGKLSVNIY